MEKDNDIVVLRKYATAVDAEIARGALESAGITAGVTGDSIAHQLTGSPISLLVMRRDVEQARAILDQPADTMGE